MASNVNQHFVPQYYFKHFTAGRRSIHLLHKVSGRIILGAPIKGQCAKANFYGVKELEAVFSSIETAHASAIRDAIRIAWTDNAHLGPDIVVALYHAIAFQRSRTELEVAKDSPAREALHLNLFRNFIEHSVEDGDRDTLLNLIDNGGVTCKAKPHVMVLQSIDAALESFPLMADLSVYLIRNHTQYPFIFSDSPVVFCNSYLRNITSRGVLGLQTPGLQIFLPIDGRTLVMAIDKSKYYGQLDNCIIDVVDTFDVAQLNALQLHHSLTSFYFADAAVSQYVLNLWDAHKQNIVQPKAEFRVVYGATIDGKPHDGPMYHSFEPQLNFRLDLSFIKCDPIAESEYVFQRRCSELVKAHKEHTRLKRRRSKRQRKYRD